MKKDIVLLELFSGIGGFAKGISDAGYNITNHYFSEIDKHAIANYKYNFKNSNYVGSVTDVQGSSIYPPPDIITFGSPCQDFSLAGKRAGMEGQRSSLILEAIRLISETKPSVFIWENVKGAFSSNDGADFWGIITAFANIGGYRLEWQLCNTSWFLPQNRERIYLVGHLDGRSEPGVFPFTKDGRLFNGSKKSGKGRSQTENCSTIGIGFETKADDTFIDVPKIAGCLTGGGHSGGLHSDMTTIKIKQINDMQNFGKSTKQQDRIYDSSGLMACIPSSRTENKLNIKVSSNTKKGFDIAKEGDSINLSNPNSEMRRGRVGVGVAQTLDTQCNQAVVKPVLTPNRLEKRQNGRRIKEDGEDSFTLSCQDQHGFQINDSIRRLTEIECERLQGFPDDWTKFGIYEKQVWINKKEKTFEIIENVQEIPKTQRYKMCGNAVTVDLPREIAKRLKITND